MEILITSCSELITYIFQNLEIKNLHHQFLHCYDSTKLSQRIQNLFLLVQLFVSLSFYLSERVCEVDPPCYVTADVFTVKNRKYSSSCYNVTSVAIVKVCNFFVSCQSFCEVSQIHVDVVHVTTDFLVKHWNEISLCRPTIIPALVTHFENVSEYVNKSREIDCPRTVSFDAFTTADPRSFKKYLRQTLVSCEIAKYGKVLISIFHQFFASINKIFISEGRLGTRL